MKSKKFIFCCVAGALLGSFGNLNAQWLASGGNICDVLAYDSIKLDVNDTIRAGEVKVKVTAGADTVFAPGYPLRRLSDVETYVKENRHLPEIPSEKQMKKDGVNVNEMQIKLLQKIEELTLYAIEQQKQIDRQAKQINEQAKKISNLEQKIK